MEWIVGVAIVLAAVVTVALVAWQRSQRLQKTVRLEIVNAGNVQSRYNLRAQAPENALQFRFSLAGEALPLLGTQFVAQAGKQVAAQAGRPVGAQAGKPVGAQGSKQGGDQDGRRAKVQQGRAKASALLQAGSAVAGVLALVGSILPRSIGRPLQQWASQIRNVETRASYAQQAPERISFQMSSVARAVTGKGGEPAMRPGRVVHAEELEAQARKKAAAAEGLGWMRPPAAAEDGGAGRAPAAAEAEDEGPVWAPQAAEPEGDGWVWAQTPTVEPGQALHVDLIVRSSLPAAVQTHIFQVISRAAGAEPSTPPVATEGSVQIRAGIWARRFAPYALVGTVTAVLFAALMLLGYWLVSAGIIA